MRNKETGEVSEYRMSYTVLDKFLEDNPNLEIYHTPKNLPIMSDATRLSVPGTYKCDDTFEKYIIQPMKLAKNGNTIAAGHKTIQKREW